MEVRPLSPFGAEIHGVAVGALDDPASVREAVSRARVAGFRGQDVNDRDFLLFLRQLGELMFTTGETAVDGEPDLNVVTNVGRTRKPRSVWHTDTSYVDAPPAFTALRAVEVPESGGETLFTDQVAVASTLPAWALDWLRGRTVRHAYGTEELEEEEAWHPVLRQHPVTGEVAVYLSTPERCDRVSDTDDRMAKRVIELLYRRSTRASNVYRHRWQEGDVVIWDDRLTLHRADHSNVVGDRTFHRGMVRGETPTMAPNMAPTAAETA